MRVAGALIVASATLKARGLVGYLDYASLEHPDDAALRRAVLAAADEPARALAPGRSTSPTRVPRAARQHRARARVPRRAAPELPTGSFVFVLSDFLEPPSPEVWNEALELPWDVVPVIVQDPVWEQSFPAVGGVGVPFADPATGDRAARAADEA